MKRMLAYMRCMPVFAAVFFPFWAYGQSVVYTDHNRLEGKPYDFAFVHLTDTHIGEGDADGDYGTFGWNDTLTAADEGYSAERLRKSVAWINAHADSLRIRFVVVTGDLTDSGERSEYMKFKEIMDALRVPYVPIIGNHDMWPYTRHTEAASPCGDSLLNAVFADVFTRLAHRFPGWDNGTRLTRTANPKRGNLNYLQNYSFSYHGYLFMPVDFGTRAHAERRDKGVGPQADLHDFPGGTLPWLVKQLQNRPGGRYDVFLLTHWPATKDPLVNKYFSSMAFGLGEYHTLAEALYPYRDRLAIWLSGHIHRDRSQEVALGDEVLIVPCIETAANKRFKDGHFRVVRVW